MKKYSLTVRVHQEELELGVDIAGVTRSYFDVAANGMTAAHDIIEHTTKPNECPYVDELMALGGIVAGRIRFGYPYYSSGRLLDFIDLRYDICSLFLDALLHSGMENPLTSAKKCRSTIDCNDTMLSLKESVESGIVLALKEWEGKGREDIYKLLTAFDIDSIVGWICKGYRAFCKRFPDPVAAVQTFCAIENVINRFLKDAYEGLTVTLYVDFTLCRAHVSDRECEYYYCSP